MTHVVDAINAIARLAVMAAVALVSRLPDGVGLLILSAVASVPVLLVFRFFSDQKAIARARDRVQAHLMELRLFPDDPRTTIRSIAQLCVWNVRYVAASLRPAVVLLLPLAIFVGQLDHHFGASPLPPGQTAIVTARLSDAVDPRDVDPQLAGTGVVVETPAVRSETDRLVSWRVRALDGTDAAVHLSVAGERVDKHVAVGVRRGYVTARRSAGLLSALLHSGEPALRSDAIDWIEVDYPKASVRVLGWRFHWLTVFLVGMLGSVLVLRRPLRVEV